MADTAPVAAGQLSLFAPPSDQPARDAIRTRLDQTLFVEAGAGTGKTAALVDRVVALVQSGIPMRAIAAITFTEKAAAELRDRIRRALEVHAASGDEACRVAFDEVDHAAISTLHAFAQAILIELPLEAGLPPRIEVRDEIASGVAFDERWSDFVDRLLEDPAHEETVLTALAAGVTIAKLRTLAEKFDDNWDLLDRVPAAPAIPISAIDGWIDELDEVGKLRSDCREADDTLCKKLDEYAAHAEQLRRAPDGLERLRILRGGPTLRVGNAGRANNWPDKAAVQQRVARLAERRDAVVGAIAHATILRLAEAVAAFVTDAVAERRRTGELDFHDLLVLARALLRDPGHGARARARLRARYQRLLIDEFQDTDPIQIDLAVLLASGDETDGGRPWPDAAVDPGHLFFVGDPKQSIYRFRRADIGTFLAARDSLPVEREQLTCNFRTAAPVLGWINHVFTELIQAFPGSQPAYHALDAARPAAPAGPAVAVVGADPHADDPDADTLRRREAADVAATIAAVIDEQWAVHDPDPDAWRPARLGDICILLPARTSLGYLERALDDAGIPYRAETSSLVYATREVRDLLGALRAVDDASDELMLVETLRSSLFGCGDDDLFEYHVEHGGKWDLGAAPPESLPADHPVVESMRYLADRRAERHWRTASELLERLVRDRRVFEVGARTGRFRDVARRVRFVVDQARAFCEATGGSLRDYLTWATRQGSEGARVVETVLPETDDDSVRILTVHGAKGLEFPIVVCSGMTTQAQVNRGGVEVLFPPSGPCQIKFGPGVQTDEFELHKPIDEQMGFHEKLRLLYVACTRARDHLVVSMHRKQRNLKDDQSTWTHSELLWAASQGATFETRRGGGRAVRARPPAATSPAALPRDAWERERDAAMRAGRRRRFLAATELARRVDVDAPADPGLAKDARDLELPPWNKGRYGTAIGRAVHAVLQTADLAGSEDVDDAAAAQAAAEGVLAHAGTIATLARAALGAPTVARAAARPHWRETYVAVPFDGLTIEGYVDLVFREDDGTLTVVDYKTDAFDGDALARRLAHYRVQGAAYARAVGAATGSPVGRFVLVFLDPAGAQEVEIVGDELDAAIAQVDALLAAERAEPAPVIPGAFSEP